MPISINQEILFTDPSQVAISGVVTGNKAVNSVSVIANDQSITSQALNQDATWNTVVSFNDNKLETVAATAHYTDGTSDTTGLLLLSNVPLDHQYEGVFFGGGEEIGTVHGQHGRELYTYTAISDGNQQQLVDVIGSGGAGVAYADFTNAFETIENFRPVGPNHDKLNLSDTSLQTLAQVLHHTSMSGGDATIHIAPNESVTLTGVSKAQLANHPGDLVFTGGHALAPAT